MQWGRWIEIIKEYDCTIEYHLEKANMVANAFGLKKMALNKPPIWKERSLTELRRLGAQLSMNYEWVLIA